MPDALQRLAEQAGIAPGYHDIWGRWHSPSEAQLRELLSAMALLSGPDADPEGALAALQARDWAQGLPPVVVAREGPARVRVVLPRAALEQPLRWHLALEQGETETGEFEPAQAPRLDEREEQVAVVLELPAELPLGYHRLRVGEHETLLIQAPAACYQPEALRADGRLWGPALQLYTVRSERNWGIGDFTDLKHLAEQWGEQGASVIGLNPLHALFLHNPAHASPYSPSSRRFLNVLYLDVEAVPDLAESEAATELLRGADFQLRLKRLREADKVDYPGVAAAKLAVLERLYASFRARHLQAETPRAREFRDFQRRQGEPLRQYAVFEALYAHFRAQDPDAWSWLAWPEPYRDPASAEVARFTAEQLEAVEFYEYLQWQAERQLAGVAAHLARQGLEIGLYLDLAVSVDRGGVDGWRNQGIYALGANVGAPPDDFAREGQDWGLPPFEPRRLRESGYGAFIGALRENMRRAGALRIDHVMGLMRLYWVPHGRSAADGAYVHYPLDELLAIVALESHRNQCLVIGEDLGTVPGEVREAMDREGILSYRVLIFEKGEGGQFKPPGELPREALGSVSTHDLPTLAGYWAGHDVLLRAELGLYDDDNVRSQQVVERAQDRSRLLLALEREGLLPEGATVDSQSVPELTPELARALHRYLARSPAKLMMVQPEDVLGMIEQVNLPGSPEALHPNWRRKLDLPLESWPQDARFLQLAAALREERPLERRRRAARGQAPVIPRATYRLQLNGEFTIRDATALIPYLAQLGVSHVYCSPYLKARPGSSHGYDIIDHNAFNPEIGAVEDFQRFAETLAQHGMGQILDIVPNHMGVMGADNAWWLDVLENGPASLYAEFFDIDWCPGKPELRSKLLLPVLGAGYGEVLERGELVLRFAPASGFQLEYYEHRMPIAPASYPQLLGERLQALELRLGAEHPALLELRSLSAAFAHLPAGEGLDTEARIERARELKAAKHRLERLCAEQPEIGAQLTDTAAAYNGQPGEPASFDALHALLEAQPYRLAHWHAAADEINYRRFFDIHDLAALRMEDPAVFDATHQLILRLVGAGAVDGLRIDHPDGLYDPEAYFRRLQERAGALTERDSPALYLLVEKILASHERLPASWPVHGTTGYEFMNLATRLLVDGAAEGRLRRYYQAFTGERTPFTELLYRCKRLIMKYALASELAVLANELNRLSETDRHTRDFTLNRLRGALAEFVAWLPVYRTYARDGAISERDRHYIEYALAKSREGSRAEEAGVYDFLRRVLLREALPETLRAGAERFAMRLQQYTGAVMAKGLEDTSFYRYFPLVALNEVGGDPRQFAVDVAEFHAANQSRRARWPHTLLATATHDNKRSEDLRARMAVISEFTGEWRRHVRRWAGLNAAHTREADGQPMPSANDEYLLYQTLLGLWPARELSPEAHAALTERVVAYMIKAVREAKQHSSWINQNPDYEGAVSEFVRALLAPDSAFLQDFLPLLRRVATFGYYNSLSQVALKLTAPGVPDLYQGSELWDFSLVDPDNRRPVDYAVRTRLLAELDADLPRALLEQLDDGRAKLLLTARLLQARREHETLFRDGEYLPLASSGAKAEHLCAFARRRDDVAVLIAPRLYATLLDGQPEALPLGERWQDTVVELEALPGVERLSNVITGARVPVRYRDGRRVLALDEVLADFPVALLIAEA